MEDTMFQCLHIHVGGEDSLTLKSTDYVMSNMILHCATEYMNDDVCTSSTAKLFMFGTDEQNESTLN